MTNERDVTAKDVEKHVFNHHRGELFLLIQAVMHVGPGSSMRSIERQIKEGNIPDGIRRHVFTNEM